MIEDPFGRDSSRAARGDQQPPPQQRDSMSALYVTTLAQTRATLGDRVSLNDVRFGPGIGSNRVGQSTSCPNGKKFIHYGMRINRRTREDHGVLT